MIPVASIVITTRNRCHELRRALTSAFSQNVDVEVLVIDDGSTDGTAVMVRAEFPRVVLHERSESLGLIVRRNEGARLARGSIIFSIDDDAEFSSPSVIEQTLAEFDHEQISAVAIPFINVLQGKTVLQRAPGQSDRYITDRFIGTAHAVRRAIFLGLSGYREELIHQGEERDFCLRMLAQGYVVRLGLADPIYHHESPKRSYERMDYYGRRNDILFAWQNVPFVFLPLHLAASTVKGILCAIRDAHHPGAMFAGMLDGFRMCLGGKVVRQPVDRPTYKLCRILKKRGPLKFQHIEKCLQRNAPSNECGNARRE